MVPEGFAAGKVIFRTTHSAVALAKRDSDGLQCVVKEFFLEDASERAKNEVAFLLSLPAHPNVVAVVLDGTDDAAHPHFVMPMGGREVWNVPLGVPQLRLVAAAAANGLAHCHANGVWHLDVKQENVLVGPGLEVTVIDFDCAVASDGLPFKVLTKMRGTHGLVAPEMVTEKLCGPFSDVFSLGAMITELGLGDDCERLGMKRGAHAARPTMPQVADALRC